jgi:predicted  nucleic acid-binding Zn-ribbon protein
MFLDLRIRSPDFQGERFARDIQELEPELVRAKEFEELKEEVARTKKELRRISAQPEHDLTERRWANNERELVELRQEIRAARQLIVGLSVQDQLNLNSQKTKSNLRD